LIDLALRSEGTDPYRNLSLEESLHERGFGHESVVLLYSNSACAVVGRNQNPWAEVSESSNLPVLRRASGGGAVYHDEGNLNWALIVPRNRHDREAELSLVAAAIRKLGAYVEPGPRGGLFLAGSGPFAGAKIAGTARRFSAERVLHHGTLLVNADLDRMAASLGGIEIESSSALVSEPSPCANLASILPGIGVSEVAEALAVSLAASAIEAAERVADRAFAEAAEYRLRSWDWIWGATSDFAVAIPDLGGERARIEVRKGRVFAISGQGSEFCSRFVGLPFDYKLPNACASTISNRISH
jgi:lipoate---protein ligase